MPFLLLAAVLLNLRAFSAETNALTERSLAELSQPAKKIPFKTVLHATTGHRLLDLDTNNPAHVELRAKILQAAALAGERSRKAGLTAVRANEAGNQIEHFVRDALKEAGLDARVPRNTPGLVQATGYPDVEITGAVPAISNSRPTALLQSTRHSAAFTTRKVRRPR